MMNLVVPTAGCDHERGDSPWEDTEVGSSVRQRKSNIAGTLDMESGYPRSLP